MFTSSLLLRETRKRNKESSCWSGGDETPPPSVEAANYGRLLMRFVRLLVAKRKKLYVQTNVPPPLMSHHFIAFFSRLSLLNESSWKLKRRGINADDADCRSTSEVEKFKFINKQKKKNFWEKNKSRNVLFIKRKENECNKILDVDWVCSYHVSGTPYPRYDR